MLFKSTDKLYSAKSLFAIAIIFTIFSPFSYSFAQTENPNSSDKGDISAKSEIKQRVLDKKWIPKVWLEFVKQGPVKDNLPDFSCAGYKMGLKTIPDILPDTKNGSISKNKDDSIYRYKTFDITDPKFGAIPNDGIDDTKAIQFSIDAAGEANGGLVFFPKGRYDIHTTPSDGFIQIRNDNIILKGESRENTIFHFGSAGKADKIYRLGTVPAEQEGRHWTTLAVIGSESTTELTRYTKTVMRGGKEVHVMDTSNLVAGQTVIIEFNDPLIDTVTPSPDKVDIAAQLTSPLKLVKEQTDTFGKVSKKITWIVKIDKVLDKKRVLFSEPARFNHFLRYSPRILSFNGVKGVGIENLTIESSWQGGYRHHKPFLGEDGKIVRTAKEQDYLWGGIWFSYACDGWVRNVIFKDLTQGVIFSKCGYMTANNLTFQGLDGHAGVTIAQSHGILVENADFFARSVHPVSLKNFASGNVITNCQTHYDGRDSNNSTDAVIDFHGLFPYENLFENMQGFYICPGGDTSVMPHSGVRNVFWNIEAPENMSCYSCELKDEFMRTYEYGNTSSKTSATMYEYQPQGFFVGITRRDNKQVTMGGDSLDKQNKWIKVEGLNREAIAIPSLYKEQIRFRRGNL